MTRLFKVSLSVVALLLVALMVLTGCGKANEALTTAEEAKKAVVDATADLEAALKNKADAKELSDKVAQLTAAIQAAETVATDGDAALNTAIETAKTTITANVDALLKAHKVDVAGLIAGKADKETVYADIKTLKDMVANIEAATLAKISLEDYVSWNTVIVAYLYEIDTIKDAIDDYEALYEDDWAEIEKAFRLAEVSLYRSFGTDEDTSMADQIFQTLRDTLAKYPNPVDTIYYGEGGIVEYKASAEKSAVKAQALYNKVKAAHDANATLVESYYVINEDNELETVNLLEDALGLWKTEILKDVNTLGAIFPVYSDSDWFGDGKTDAERIAETKAQINAFGLGIQGTTVADLTAGELANFVKNEGIVAALDNATTGAVKAATDAIALAYTGDIALTHACVDAIDAWNTACNNWINTFLTANKPAVLEGENAERYAAVEALIKDTKTALDAKKAALVEAATPYVTDAQGFIDAVAKFEYSYDADGKLEKADVNLNRGQELKDAWVLAEAWAAKYEATGLRLELGFLGDKFAQKPFEALNDILALLDYYNKVVTVDALNAWNDRADERAVIATYINGTALDIYDTNIKAVIDWYEKAEGDAYGLVVDGNYQTGCTLEGLKDATKDYYDIVKGLEKQLDNLIAAMQERAEKLNAALKELAKITLSRENEITEAEALYDEHVAAGYKEDNTANGTLKIAIENYADTISKAKSDIGKIKDAKEAMDNALAAFADDANKPAAAYPYFDVTGAVAQSTYTTLKSNLSTAIANFKAENQNNEETYTTAANAKVAEADLLIKLDDALDKEVAVKNNTADLSNPLLDLTIDPSYFNATISEDTFKSAADALEAAINAYLGTEGFDAANVAEAEATLTAAKAILYKEAIYKGYNDVLKIAEDSIKFANVENEDQAISELKALRDEYRATINNYDYTADGINATVESGYAVYLTLVKAQVAENGATYGVTA